MLITTWRSTTRQIQRCKRSVPLIGVLHISLGQTEPPVPVSLSSVWCRAHCPAWHPPATLHHAGTSAARAAVTAAQSVCNLFQRFSKRSITETVRGLVWLMPRPEVCWNQNVNLKIFLKHISYWGLGLNSECKTCSSQILPWPFALSVPFAVLCSPLSPVILSTLTAVK